MSKNRKNLSLIFLCFVFVAAFSFVYFSFVKASPAGAVSFTADTIVNLSGISDGDFKI